MIRYKKLMILCCAASAVVACKQNGTQEGEKDSTQRTVFFDKSGMDTTVSPGDDFFEYANGLWIKNTKIPDDKTSWGSFRVLYQENVDKLHTILEKAQSGKNAEGSLEQKVGDFYASGMDTVALDKKGFDPIKPTLAKIDALKSIDEMLNFVADGEANGVGSTLLGYYIGADEKISTKNALNLSQAGINLPDKSYYFDKESEKIRSAYKKHIVKLFTLVETDSVKAKKYADEVFNLESKLATSHSSRVELRNPEKNYNKFAVTEFQKQTPNLNWANLFAKMQIKTDTVIVGQPKYYTTLSALVKSVPLEVWKTKLKLDVINGSASVLSTPFRKENFEFYAKTLNGQLAETPRWQQMVQKTDGTLGELLGQLYVERYFTPEAKKRMNTLVDNLQKVYEEHIKALDWMSTPTKEKALAKLNAFMKKIGFPDKWEDYSDVKISKDDFFANLMSTSKHAYKKMIEKLGKPVDKSEWQMTPPTVNAYYNPTYNEIVFPAGILQFPFFDFNADDAINYGAIGAVIGHEMTHGFDDQGRQYDKEGNLTDWWSAEDAKNFKVKADQVVKQYNGFTVLDNQHVNGELTLGENIADIGGLAIAYDAFLKTEESKSDKKTDGFTPKQRFFLGFAQVWRLKTRDETMKVRLKTDPHSPEHWRVDGTVYNMDAFYDAFNVKPGSKMYKAPQDRIRIW